MRKLLYFFINKIRAHIEVLNARDRNAQVTLGEYSVLHKEAMVSNLSHDPAKISIGKYSHIRGELTIWPYSKGLHIGDHTFVGTNSVIRSGEEVTIGSRVLIAHNVTIIDSNSHELDYKERHQGYVTMLESGFPDNAGNVKTSPIVIEDDVWISYNVSILKGVKIGRGAIIGACSLIAKDVEPFTLVSGNPAVVVKKLDQE